jgi:tetratricopeptide repeat protein
MNALPILVAAFAVAGEPDGTASPDGAGAAASWTSPETLFQRGVDAYDEGRYDAALRSFREAYRLAPEPSILFNMAQAYHAVGDCRQALECLDGVITANGADRSLVSRARAKRDDFERCASAQAPPAPVVPTRAAVPAPRIVAAASPSTMVLAPAPPSQPPRSSWVSSKWGKGCMISAGAAIGLTVAGIGLTWAAHDRANVVEDAVTWSSDVQAADSERRGLATAATTTFVAGGATAIVSSVMCWLGWRRRD